MSPSSDGEDIVTRRQSDNGKLDSWRIKVDGDISGLSKKMAGFESILSNVAHGMDSLAKKFDTIQSEQASNSKTQWPIILSSLALVGVIIGGFMGGYVRDLSRVEGSSNDHRDQFVEHISDGHPGRIEDRVISNYNLIKELDVTLQREMRLLISNESSDLGSLDIRLQREMDLINSAQIVRDNSLDRRLNKIEDMLIYNK